MIHLTLPEGPCGLTAKAVQMPHSSSSHLQEYTYLAFPSETITRSGYQIRRRNFAVAATKRGMVYTLAAR